MLGVLLVAVHALTHRRKWVSVLFPTHLLYCIVSITVSHMMADHFAEGEGEDEDALRTICVVNSMNDVREDDATAIKIFR